ncbi:MAG: hypothetical protein EOM20_15425, partial [Spartobacteria bacterium]|nr:hypothetical protein [Spartobacteria bacterium]
MLAMGLLVTAAVANELPDAPDAPPAKNTTRTRDYSGRVDMHQTPFSDAIVEDEPDNNFKERALRRSSSDYGEGSFYQNISPGPRTLPSTPPPRKTDKKKNNWLTISTDEALEDKKSGFVPAGWGWLADEAFNFQAVDQRRREGRGEQVEEDDDEGDALFDATLTGREETSMTRAGSLWKSYDLSNNEVWKENVDETPSARAGYVERDKDGKDSESPDRRASSRDESSVNSDIGNWADRTERENGYETRESSVYGYGDYSDHMWSAGSGDNTLTRNLSVSGRDTQRGGGRDTPSTTRVREPSFTAGRSIDYTSYADSRSDYSSYNG